ncbi:MAG: carbohydrate-binding protein [Bacteroidetes bacterium]|nr:carbohydrate-binding protein [Bacteroidota bacterium]
MKTLKLKISSILLCAATAFFINTNVAVAQVPVPDHIVIVVMENHKGSDIIGSANAPFINSLATGGAQFTQSYGVTHPSQPNYLHLFSGSNQGVVDDALPKNTPYSTPNLGASLLAKSLTFGGYSEDLPSVGSLIEVSGTYVRKHNPWCNWQGSTNYNVPSNLNMPMTSFPSQNFASLPTVSFVIPNMAHDMHDGGYVASINTGDVWLKANLEAYAQWALANNSLLIVTFDEDDFTITNQIATIFYGQPVKAGSYSEKITHHNVLRTIEEMYGLPYIGASANVSAITDCWNISVAKPSIALSQSTAINEGSENGKTITITLSNGSFAANLSAANWTLANLPTGVTKGSVVRTSNTVATITLNGNSTLGTYASDIINVSVTATAAEIVSATSSVSATSGITLSKGPSAIPGKIEAEIFKSMVGVQSETTADVGGGQDIGYIDSGDILTYAVNVQSTGTYTASFRIASTATGKTLKLTGAGGTPLYGTVNLPNTTGWQVWQTVTMDVQLTAGIQDISITTATGGFNLNWIDFAAKISNASIALSQPTSITEGAEDGKTIVITLSNDKFAANITAANWTLGNLPAGVTKGSVVRNSDTQVTITLNGNSTVGTYSADITNVSVTATQAEFLAASSSVSANSGLTFTKYIVVSNGTAWTSTAITMNSTLPQATVSANNVSANLEFYESTNNDGVDQGALFSTYSASAHPEAANNAAQRWYTANYPYAAISNVARGSDAGETNAPSPAGAFDLMLHPPSNAHLSVCAFTVPTSGNYVISGLAARRVLSSGGNSLFKVFNSSKQLIATVTATNNRAWVTDANSYSLSNLQAGDKIYFAVDNDIDYSYDATEIAWTISIEIATEIKTSPIVNSLMVYPNPIADQFQISGTDNLNLKVQVYDLSGQTILNSAFNKSNKSFDLSDAPAGIYFVAITDENNVVNRVKVVKQ